MRSILAASSLVILVLAVGCNLAPHHRDSVGNAPAANTATPTAENLVVYLNKNAKLIDPGQALNCTNVMIDIDADGTRVGISAMMQCQAPRNFLMKGVALGSPVVDIGSNNKEFWFWSREIKPAYLYHCSYDAMATGVNIPFPFQPDMVVKALGLAQYDPPTKQYDVRISDDKRAIQLTEHTRSPENKPIQKVTVFNAQQVQQLSQPQVIGHIIKDEQNKVICAASIRLAQRVGDNGPIIPRIIDFNWPEQKMKMTMRIENPRLVAMPSEKATMIFTREKLQYQAYDLSTKVLDPSGVQQAGVTGATYRP